MKPRPELPLACAGAVGSDDCPVHCPAFAPSSFLPVLCSSCQHHRGRHHIPPEGCRPPSATSGIFVPLRPSTSASPTSTPTPSAPSSPSSSPAAPSSSIPTAPALLSAKKRVYKLSDSVKQRQQLRFVHVHQLGYGQLMQPSAPAHEDDVVEVRLAGWEASAYVPFRQLTDRVTVDVRTFHTFSDKVKVAEDGDKERQAALIPTVFALEVALSSTVMQGLVHPILDLYAACGVELEEEEVRIIANGRELTSPVPAASSSVLIVDTALVPFAPLLLIVDPQSSFTLDPASSTSSSLLLSPSHLTVSITSDTYGYGYYGCGNTYRQGSSKSYGSPYRTGDIITVVLDCDARKMSFKKNDEALGVAFEDLPNVLYPALSLYSKDDSVSIIDFGQHV